MLRETENKPYCPRTQVFKSIGDQFKQVVLSYNYKHMYSALLENYEKEPPYSVGIIIRPFMTHYRLSYTYDYTEMICIFTSEHGTSVNPLGHERIPLEVFEDYRKRYDQVYEHLKRLVHLADNEKRTRSQIE